MQSSAPGVVFAWVLVTVLAACEGDATPADGAVAPPGPDGAVADAASGDGATPDAGIGPVVDAAVDAPPPPPPGSLTLADGLRIQSVAVYQAVRIAIAEDGAPADRNGPIVAGRDAVVRVSVQPDAGWTAREVTARLLLRTGGVATGQMIAQSVAGPSMENDPSSVFDFEVSGEDLTEDSFFWVALTTPDGTAVSDGVPADARYPRDGSEAALGAESDLGGLALTLVPLRYDTDGSGRLPDTGPAQLDLYRSYLGALFPYSTINITVREPVPWNESLGWDNEVEFGDVNSMLIDLREADGATADEYYFALVEPHESRDTYCDRAFGACTTGQSFVVRDADDDRTRLGSALGYGGEAAARTLAHELGHIHGRNHAPCGVSGSDRAYPYASGSTGVWGRDPRDGTMYDPADATDVMGYCSDRWISDYTYRALFERNLDIKALTALSGAAARGGQLSVLHLEGGVSRWGRDLTLEETPAGFPVSVSWHSEAGTLLGSSVAVRVEQSHADGALLLLRKWPGAARAHVALDGVRYESTVP